ncbi:MAG: acyl-CoA thioesterase-1 [Paracoccaceae bacterium]|jgi:acyl-CoA thioesterase-1
MRKMLVVMVFWWCGFTATAEPLTIAALGDSLTQGYGLAQSDGFVPQLQAWLDAQGVDVRLINAGVSGDTTAGGAARVAWTLTPDVAAMIVALGGNDMLRGLDPAEARSNLDTILRTAQQAGVGVLLVGMRAPGNFGADYKAEFDAIYPALAQEYDAGFAPDFLAAIIADGTDPSVARTRMQADGIHPNAAGVASIVADLGPAVLELVQRTRAEE